MVAKGIKRKSEPTEAEVTADKCKSLATAITDSATLPSDVVAILTDLLPHSLGQPKDKRHRFQEQAVQATDRVIQGIEESLKKKIEDAKNELHEAKHRAAPCEAAVTEAEEKLRTAKETFARETKALAQTALAFRAARNAVQDALKAQESGDEEFKVAAQKKSELQAIIDDSITPLQAGTVEDLEVCKELCKALVATLKELDGTFDEAMLMVLESSFAKVPSARSMFDTMAIGQLDKYMAEKIQPLDATLQSGEVGKQQRAADVQAAQKSLEVATGTQMLGSQAFETAWNTRNSNESTLKEARKAGRDLTAQTKESGKAVYAAEADYDVFLDCARKPFEELKERLAPEPVPEPVVEPAALDMETTSATNEVTEDAKFDAGVAMPEAIAA